MEVQDSVETRHIDGAACGFIAAGTISFMHNKQLPINGSTNDELARASSRPAVTCCTMVFWFVSKQDGLGVNFVNLSATG